MSPWGQCASVSPGGKPYFYIKKVDEYGPENWGFWRIVWDRRVLAWRATKDHKYGDRPRTIGFYGDVREAKAACDALESARALALEN